MKEQRKNVSSTEYWKLYKLNDVKWESYDNLTESYCRLEIALRMGPPVEVVSEDSFKDGLMKAHNGVENLTISRGMAQGSGEGDRKKRVEARCRVQSMPVCSVHAVSRLSITKE